MSSDSIAPFRIVTGDATAPATAGPALIAHVCNDIGGWGRGFVLALSRRWPAPEARYRAWATGRGEPGEVPFALGAVQFVRVTDTITVANMVAQRDVRVANGIPPIRYDALADALMVVGDAALALGATVHMPRIGCGLAGGRWEVVEPIVRATLTDRGVPVTVYDWPTAG
jgi:O-acetyl-ADP-ribose deacetylase (regulator of RNase III)